MLVTKAKDGSLVVAVWNIVNPGSTGDAEDRDAAIQGQSRRAPRLLLIAVDATHGDTLDLWQKMGSPQYPTQQQLQSLRQSSQLPPPEMQKLSGGTLTLPLPVNGLAVLTVK